MRGEIVKNNAGAFVAKDLSGNKLLEHCDLNQLKMSLASYFKKHTQTSASNVIFDGMGFHVEQMEFDYETKIFWESKVAWAFQNSK